MASWFSTTIFFITSLALVLGLACETCSTPFQDYIAERLNLQDFLTDFFNNPVNFGIAALGVGAVIATGNVLALTIPLVLMIYQFFLPVDNLITEMFAGQALPPEVGMIKEFIAIVIKGALLIAAILLYRGIFDT